MQEIDESTQTVPYSLLAGKCSNDSVLSFYSFPQDIFTGQEQIQDYCSGKGTVQPDKTYIE